MRHSFSQEVESIKTSVLLGIAAGYRQFVRGVAESPIVHQLLQEMRSSQDITLVLLRVLYLVNSPIDRQYENPHDVALAIYLHALRETEPQVSSLAAELVRKCPNCWWAWKVAADILASRKSANRVQTTQTVMQTVTTGPGVVTPQVIRVLPGRTAGSTNHEFVAGGNPPTSVADLQQKQGSPSEVSSLGAVRVFVASGEVIQRNQNGVSAPAANTSTDRNDGVRNKRVEHIIGAAA